MYRLALSSTSPSNSIVSNSAPDNSALQQSKLQRQLHQAIRDSIIAERILHEQARNKGRLSPQDVEQQRLAKQKWELSNKTLRRLADEQTRLIQLARQRNDMDAISHPRLQQAFAEAFKDQERGHHQMQPQSVSENTPDIEDFIYHQEKAFSSVQQKLKESRKRQQSEQMNGQMPQHIVDFIMKQEQELEAIRRKTQTTRTMVPQRLSPPVHHRLSVPTKTGAPTKPRRRKPRSFDEYIRKQEAELVKIQQKQQQLPRKAMPKPSSSDRSETTTSSSLSDFLKEQRMALESYQRQASQKRQRPPSPPESVHQEASHHQIYADQKLPPSQHYMPELLQPKRSWTPLPRTFQDRPKEQAQPPSLLVYNNHPSSAQSLSTIEPSYCDPIAKHTKSANALYTRAFQENPSKHFPPPVSYLPSVIHPSSQETVISGVSDIISILEEQQQPESNMNQDTIRKCLGMNDNCCCLRHPNQLICEYTPVYKFDKIKHCRICASESRAGGSTNDQPNERILRESKSETVEIESCSR